MLALLTACSGEVTPTSESFDDEGWLLAATRRAGAPAPGIIRSVGEEVHVAPRSARAPRVVLLPGRKDGFELEMGGERLVVRREGSVAGPIRHDGSTLRYEAAPDQEVAFYALEDRVEELVRVQRPEARVVYDFELAAGHRLVPLGHGLAGVQVVDAGDHPLVRMTAPKLWDRQGEEFPIEVSLEGSRVELSAPHGARFPVVMDPTWSSAHDMASARYRHTSTLLPDGRVLVAGGAAELSDTPGIGAAPLDSAELFDPTTTTYDSTARLSVARWGHTATLLRNGKVLIVGGFDENLEPLASAELFDPEKGEFESTGDLSQGRGAASATRLGDGRVLVLGGTADLENPITKAEIYDPDEGTFADAGEPTYSSYPHAAALMPDGRVAIAWNDPAGWRLELFDPNDDSFGDPGMITPPTEAGGPDVVAVADPVVADVVIVSDLGRICRFNLTDQTVNCWPEPAGNAPGVGTPFTISLQNNQLKTFGDPAREPGASTTLVRYAATGVEWLASYEDKRPTRWWGTSTTLPSNTIVSIGGLSDEPLASSDLFAEPGAFPVEVTLDAVSPDHAATLLQDGGVLFTGGASGTVMVYRWDGETVNTEGAIREGATEVAGELLAKRRTHQALLLESGKVLVAGGETDPADAEEELFDPGSGESEPAGFRLHARGSALTVSNGRVLFAGSAGLELVNTRDWTVTAVKAPVELDCETPALTRLASGRALVVGKSAAFELDPFTGKTSDPVELIEERCGAAAAALPNGKVMIVGQTNSSTANAEIVDPRAGITKSWETFDSNQSVLNETWAFASFDEVRYVTYGDTHSLSWVDSASNVTVSRPLGREPDSVIRLATSSFLILAPAPSYVTTGSMALLPGEPSSFTLDRPSIEVRPGEEITLEDLPFSTTWPEGTSGTTAASATNSPVAIWMPAVGGWPVTGTFTKWSSTSATWKVPNTPFPGLGFLSYALHGEMHALMPVAIVPSEQGDACSESGECESGYCVDGVCCNTACDTACEACTAAAKGDGADGTCGPVPAGEEDSRCEKEAVRTCGQSGLCDGASGCALYPEGEPCAENKVCTEGFCERPSETAEPPPVATCDGDHTVDDGSEVVDCSPFRCSLSTNECLLRCSTNVDCADGYRCSAERTCETFSELPTYSVGCMPGCRVGGDAKASWLALGWGLLLFARRRRQRYHSS